MKHTGLTRTGTRAVTVTVKGLAVHEKTILFEPDGKIIAFFDVYHGISSQEIEIIEGSQVAKLVSIIEANFEKFGCMWNERSDLWKHINLADKLQRQSGFHYDYPLHRFVEKFEKSQDYFYAAQKNIELIELNKRLEKRIETLKNYGTENEKQIAKIKKERELAAKKQAKQKAKERKILEAETKKMLLEKIKAGFTYVAIRRNWTGSRKHLKFQGESAEFSMVKPSTRNWFELSKSSIDSCVRQYLSV